LVGGLVMTKGYWIVSVDISNPESYKHYIAENRNAFRKFGARFLIRGGKSEIVEGTGRTRIVVLEFKDYATALECYHSAFFTANWMVTAKRTSDVLRMPFIWRKYSL
jgi:uncharacterized protein (DUF1330 family)